MEEEVNSDLFTPHQPKTTSISWASLQVQFFDFDFMLKTTWDSPLIVKYLKYYLLKFHQHLLLLTSSIDLVMILMERLLSYKLGGNLQLIMEDR